MMTFTNRFLKTGPSLSDADLDGVESRLGRRLPAEFRALYLQANGGEPERRYYPQGLDGFIEYEVQVFLPMVHRTSWSDATVEDEFEYMVVKRELLPAYVVPFAVGSGGDYYCLNAKDEVVFIPMDSVSHEPQRVAASITDFVNGLVTAEELYGEPDLPIGDDD